MNVFNYKTDIMNCTDVSASSREAVLCVWKCSTWHGVWTLRHVCEQLQVPVTERQGHVPSPEPGLTPVTTVTQNTMGVMPRNL